MSATDIGPNPLFTFDTFVAVKSNELALSAASAFADFSLSQREFLFLYGPSGVGKTHLLHAIANRIAVSNSHNRVVLASSKYFLDELIQSISQGNINAFHEKYRRASVLLLDNFEVLAGKVRPQEEFFLTFEDLAQRGGRIAVVGSDAMLGDSFAQAVKTRIHMGLVFGISVPSTEEKEFILKTKYAEAALPPNLMKTICRQSGDNFPRAEGLVRRVAFQKQQSGTFPTVRDVISWFQDEPPAVFLSYAWQDQEAVRAVDQWLRDQGARVIRDENDFWAGDDIQEQIIRCIQKAGVVVCFYSRNSARRPYPKLERRIAEEMERIRSSRKRQTRVIYFCLDDTNLPVQQKFRVAVRAKGRSFDEACNTLWRGISKSVGVPARLDLGKYQLNPPW